MKKVNLCIRCTDEEFKKILLADLADLEKVKKVRI